MAAIRSDSHAHLARGDVRPGQEPYAQCRGSLRSRDELEFSFLAQARSLARVDFSCKGPGKIYGVLPERALQISETAPSCKV